MDKTNNCKLTYHGSNVIQTFWLLLFIM